MPYTSAHLLINFGGALPGGEQWSIGFRTLPANTAAADLQAYADFARSAFESFWTTGNFIANMNPPAVTFNKVIVRQVGVNGKTQFQAESVPTTPFVGNNARQGAPNQTCLVVSLLTARSGRSYRGRVYLPFLSPPDLQPGGRLAAPNAAGILAQAQYLVGVLSDPAVVDPTLTGVPAAVFRIAIQSETSGQPASPVTVVRVGDVLDTQRRRRDKLTENYLSGVVAT